MLKKTDPTQTSAWKKLTAHYEENREFNLRKAFEENKNRASEFSIFWNDIYFDYSKNLISSQTMELLIELAEECDLQQAIEQMFCGEIINTTEKRAVLHTALRNQGEEPVYFAGKDVMPQIRAELKKMESFSRSIRSGKWLGYSGAQITDIVNIGIGGSDLGPKMVCEALKPFAKDGLKMHFVSNVDPADINETLKLINPQTTLFMIASKTFTTQETMTNAHTARNWFLANGGTKDTVASHFVAISTNEKKVNEFGISSESIFRFWDWVGGRYSLWSAIGLSIMCYIGYDNYIELLTGAWEMDKHFRNTEYRNNIPVIMGLLGIWYNNFFGCQSQAILPYDQYLHRFPAYLQQADMESNGKSIDRAGNMLHYQTGPVIWGEPGTNGQHAFYQLIHQGTKLVPCDFLAAAQNNNPSGDHHAKLLANFFAQTEALMKGKTPREAKEELIAMGMNDEDITRLVPYKTFAGNKPTNSVLYRKLTPRTLGSLIAVYEHKIFTQGVIWNIYSFDQWGVELGKQLAIKILPELISEDKIFSHDSSTNNLINIYKEMNEEHEKA